MNYAKKLLPIIIFTTNHLPTHFNKIDDNIIET